MPNGPIFLLAFVVFGGLLQNTGFAQQINLRRGTIKKIAASSDFLTVETEDELIQIDLQGVPLFRFPKPVAREGKVDWGGRKQDTRAILDGLNIDSRDPVNWNLETLLESEERLSSRRDRYSTRSGRTMLPQASAFEWGADLGRVWILSAGTLYWLDAIDGLRRVGFVGPQTVRASKDSLLLGADRRLLYRNLADGLAREWTSDAPIRAISLSGSGRRLAWSTGSSVKWISFVDGENVVSVNTPVPILEMGFCGEELLGIAGDRLLVIGHAQGLSWVPIRGTLDTILCAPSTGDEWVLAGKEIVRSVDGGKSWQEFKMPPGAVKAKTAASQQGVWVASGAAVDFWSWEGLWDAKAFKGQGPRVSRRPGHAPWWHSLVPKVTLDGQVRQSQEKQDVRGFMLATFPLDWGQKAVPVVQEEGNQAPWQEEKPPLPTSPPSSVISPKELGCLAEAKRAAVQLAFAEPERAASYLRRAANAAWLPEVRFLMDRRLGRSESMDYSNSALPLSTPLGVDTVNDARYEARATWDLSRIVFSSEEMAAQNQVMRMAEQRREIELQVSRLFFERVRLQQGAPTRPARGAPGLVKQHEIVAELDVLTGNRFSGCIAGTMEALE